MIETRPIVSAPLRGSLKTTLALFLLAGFVGWGDSPSAPGAEPAAKAGAAPQPTGSAQPATPSPASSPDAKAAKPATFLKYESMIPKRELVFDQSEDELTYYLPRDSSEMPAEVVTMVQEQRYVAVVVIKFRIPRPVRQGDGSPIYHPGDQYHSRSRSARGNVGNYFDRLLDGTNPQASFITSGLLLPLKGLAANVPTERLPPNDVLEMLTSQLESSPSVRVAGPLAAGAPQELEAEFASIRARMDADRESPKLQPDFLEAVGTWSLRAPTADRAKDLVRPFLTVFDYGGSLPKYETYVELKQYYESKLPELQAAVKEAEQKYKEADKALEKFSETAPKEQLPKEEIAKLAAQQRLIAVEEAGVKARIAASEKMLTTTASSRPMGTPPGGSMPNPNYDALVTVKTTAEIELVSLAAKRAAIQEILDSSKKRSELGAKRNSLANVWGSAQSRLKEAESRLAIYRTAVEQKMPFAEVEGKVYIRRIKWEEYPTSSGASRGRGAPSPTPNPASRGTRGRSG